MNQQPDFQAELDRAIEVSRRMAPELLRRPGVIAVGPGPERRRGVPTGRAAIVVTVREKLSAARLRALGYDPLPKQIEGVPVDVVALGVPVEGVAARRAIERATRAKEKVEADWLRRPNITGVGVGYKLRDGQNTGQVSIVFLVARKLPTEALRAQGIPEIPAEIGGVPTDVIQAGPFGYTVAPSGSRADRQDPLAGGLAIGHASAPFHYGTLAAVAFDNANNAVALSNEHVLDGDIGETVHQPSPVGLDDSFEVSLQLDVCNPLNFLRIDTPDTTAGSILAGAAAAAALAAALSDDIDPTRLGQQATPPPAGARTVEEYTKVHVEYPEFPRPGTPFKLAAKWHYERRLDSGGPLAVDDGADRENPHVLRYHRLFVDRAKYDPSQTIRLFGVVIPLENTRLRCRDLHCVGILHPLHLDRSYPVVLRSIEDRGELRKRLSELFNLLAELDLSNDEIEFLKRNLDRLCLFYGEFSAAGVPLGPWQHWMFVQTVNTVPPGSDPLKAATIIGGLPLSNHYTETVDIACGPFVFDDDGSFDIELLSI